jgi:N6-adenosine-specific RNA methylase IME4
MKLYSVFCIDPPWPKKKGGLRATRPNQGRPLDYKTMGIDSIFALLEKDIFVLSEKQSTVFLWCVDQFLRDAETEMLSRGFRMHARLVWDKGNGVAPAFSLRYSHEYVGWWYKPTFMPVAIESRGIHRSVFSETPREHSRKPDVFYDIVSSWFPSANKLDVFSRQKRNGWDQYGDECEKFS